jgi:hypothetical protein
MSTVLKLYTGTVYQTMSEYAESSGLLSESQYGFRTGRRTHEQILWLQTIIDSAHTTNSPIRACWVDFRNAFCSVDHGRILESMRAQQYPQHFLTAIEGLYAPGSTTAVRTGCGATERIPIERGILQGDLLSPLVFAIMLEPLLRKLELSGNAFEPLRGGKAVTRNSQNQKPETPTRWGHAVGAYADDLVLVTSNVEQMQDQLAIVHAFCQWSGMSSNNGKCGYGGWSPPHLTADVAAEAKTLQLCPNENVNPIPHKQHYPYLDANISLDNDTVDNFDALRAKLQFNENRQTETI